MICAYRFLVLDSDGAALVLAGCSTAPQSTVTSPAPLLAAYVMVGENSVYDDRGVQGGSASLLSVMKTLHPLVYYPSTVRLALHGHVHLFEAINFSSNHPATILSGMDGDELSTVLPDPFPLNIAPAEGVTLDSIARSNQFGFIVMNKHESAWQIGAHDVLGSLKTTCILTGAKLRCDKTGLVK